MKDKKLLLGLLLIIVGIAARLIPHVNTGLSVFTILEVVGILLVFVTIAGGWGGIREWVRARAWGRQFRFLCGFLLFAVCFQCIWAVVDEIEGGRKYAKKKAALERKDPEAALALSALLTREENAPLRERLIERIAELGRPPHSAIEVTTELFRRLKADPETGVREAAAKALPVQMERADILRIVAELPGLDDRAKPLAAQVLETFTGKVFGEDASRWRDWLGTSWAGAEGDGAYALADLAYRTITTDPALRDAALSRLGDGRGISEDRLLLLAQDSDPALRAAGATAIGTARAKGLLRRLVSVLKSEKEAGPAGAQARAVADLDPPASWLLLLDVVGAGVDETSRAAAKTALGESLGTGLDLHPSAYMGRVYRKLPKGKDQEDLFRSLLRMAGDSAPARRELAHLFGDPKVKPWDRIRALKKLQETDASDISKEMLTEVSREETDPELVKFAREELERR